jgi:hypothetical protein
MLAFGVKFSWYRNCEKEFQKYYAQEDQLLFCMDIRNLLYQLGEKEYDPSTCAFLSTLPKEVLRPFYFKTAMY